MSPTQRDDDQRIAKALGQALDATDVPDMPWSQIARGIRQRPEVGRHVPWWASAAAVLVLLVAVAFATRLNALRPWRQPSPAATARAGSDRHAAVPRLHFCTVTFHITGLNAMQALGEIHATLDWPGATVGFTAITPYGGEAEAVCREARHPTTVTLTESLSIYAKSFRSWTLNGDDGRFRATTVTRPRVRFTLTGDTSVTANFTR